MTTKKNLLFIEKKTKPKIFFTFNELVKLLQGLSKGEQGEKFKLMNIRLLCQLLTAETKPPQELFQGHIWGSDLVYPSSHKRNCRSVTMKSFSMKAVLWLN